MSKQIPSPASEQAILSAGKAVYDELQRERAARRAAEAGLNRLKKSVVG